MGITRTVEQLHQQLFTIRKKLNWIKKTRVVCVWLCIFANLYILHYHFKVFYYYFKMTTIFIASYILLVTIYYYTQQINCKRIEHQIYLEQKLKI